MADLFRNEARIGYIDSCDSFSNETPLCCSDTQNSSAVALIGTIYISEIEQNNIV